MQIKEPQDHSIRVEKTTTTIQTILKMHRYKINAVLCHNLRDLTTLVFQGSTCTIYNNTELYTTYVNIAWLCCRFYRFMLPGKSQLYQFSGYKNEFGRVVSCFHCLSIPLLANLSFSPPLCLTLVFGCCSFFSLICFSRNSSC